jgi:hypothetical protein
MTTLRLFFGVGLLALLFARTSSGGPPGLPPELVDPGFARYVDLQLVGRALREGDANTLADTALQLAEGERILLRPHRSLKVPELLQAALQLATDDRDMECLDRLAMIAEQRKDEAFAGQIAQARKLAAAARDPEAELRVSLDECTPQQYAMICRCCSDVRLAKVTGDTRSLELWDSERLDHIPDPYRPHLDQLLGEVRSALPTDTEREVSVLGKIAAQSRRDAEIWEAGGYGSDPTFDSNNEDSRVMAPEVITPAY